MELPYIGFILLIYINCICGGEEPTRSCMGDRPFRLSDNTCVNFTDICLKDDAQCKNFQTACKQCPPSNYSVIIYLDIMNLKNQLSTTNKNLEDLRNKFMSETKRNPEQTNNILILCSIILALIITMHFLLIIEYRFKIMTKLCQAFKWKDSNYQILSSRKREDNHEVINQIKKYFSNYQESQKKNHEELLDQIKIYQMLSSGIPINSVLTSNNNMFEKIQFLFDGIDQEPIELYIHNNHNIVQVKQLICAKLPHAKHDDYKIMKLKYNGNILNDDNQYLLENINKSNTIVNCFIDSSMNARDILVVKLQGKMRLPDVIQINKNQSIDQLMEIIEKIINSKDFSLFKEIDNKKEYLIINTNLKDLSDGNLIRVILRQMGKLIIKSMFDDDDFRISVDYLNVDPVSIVIDKIHNKYSWDKENFILFFNNGPVQENTYFFQFEISDEFVFKICHLAKFCGIKENSLLETGGFWDLNYATKEETNTKLLLKKYKNVDLSNWKTKEWMLNELKVFAITKSQPRFIQLSGIYINGTSLYVAMENMAEGTLKYYLKNNKNLNEHEIDKQNLKWILQIVEALNFLHHHKIIHRDLNPSSILLDENIDLKLSSFNLSKYEEECSISSVMQKEYIGQIKIRYLAPEILDGKSYGFPCDIWSLGVVMVMIVTGKRPFSELTTDQAKLKIIESGTIEYEISNKLKEKEMKLLIDSCLKKNPEDRCTLDNLYENQLIKNYLLNNN